MSVEELIASYPKPEKVVVTAGMPYANGEVHIGHLSSCHIPADVYARWMRMLIGEENVLYVCGADEHGAATELAAREKNKPIREYLDENHARQLRVMEKFNISLDVYSGTSRPEVYETHKKLCQDFIRKLYHNGMLQKRSTRQWYDPQMGRFLQDRFVVGTCPKCGNTRAYSDSCEACGAQFDPTELREPRSALSNATPELRETMHWFLDMWKVSDVLADWVRSKEKSWRQLVYNEVINTVLPSLSFSNTYESKFKEIKSLLPKHKSKYAPGKQIAVQFENKGDFTKAQEIFAAHEIPVQVLDGWAYRSITRDIPWGIPVPEELDPDLRGKTFYVWPDSLVAPIAFTQLALQRRGLNPELYKEFWCNPRAKVTQFLGQDNIYFYVIMQGAMWLGTQDNPLRLPHEGELQLTDILASYHLMVEGQKLSKSLGNAYSADELLDQMGYSADQIRYFICLLTLSEKRSNFDFAVLKERNKFLAGPMNAAFEKPISAAHSKFNGMVPDGKIIDNMEDETKKIVKKYLHYMERAEYSTLLFAIENYARNINSLFNKYKPHDDRHPEEQRRNALYTSFYLLRNLMIMLYPFAPETMNRVRESLNLPLSVFRMSELGKPLPAGHKVGSKQQYFPPVVEDAASQ